MKKVFIHLINIPIALILVSAFILSCGSRDGDEHKKGNNPSVWPKSKSQNNNTTGNKTDTISHNKSDNK